jgi:hypothetical protein
LHDFANPQLLYFEDILSGNISDEWKRSLQRRIDGSGCPILVWAIHNVSRGQAIDAGLKILEATDRSLKAADLSVAVARDGSEAYVIYMTRTAR